jgi:hypothetical protein
VDTRIDSYENEPYIETATGLAFHFNNPRLEEISIEDICTALSKLCRYSGHINKFYSVAEHCCHLFDYATATGNYTKQELRTLLLHDASEAYLVDVARPIKVTLPDYMALENKLETIIAKKFDLIYPFPQFVKVLDTRILLDERKQLKNPSPHVWAVDKLGLDPLNIEIGGWAHDIAAAEFMWSYNKTL